MADFEMYYDLKLKTGLANVIRYDSWITREDLKDAATEIVRKLIVSHGTRSRYKNLELRKVSPYDLRQKRLPLLSQFSTPSSRMK